MGGQDSYFRKPPRFWGVPEDFLWKRASPFLPDCCLKGEEERCDDEGRDDCLAEPLWADEPEGRRRLDCDDDEEAFRCGLKSDRSRAEDLADSTDEASNREPVWKNGSESRFLFCASETEGTTCERRSCLLFMVMKAVLEANPEAMLLQAFEKDFCSWEMTGSSLGRSFFSYRLN